jgi:hypothetical protein
MTQADPMFSTMMDRTSLVTFSVHVPVVVKGRLSGIRPSTKSGDHQRRFGDVVLAARAWQEARLYGELADGWSFHGTTHQGKAGRHRAGR